jgi:acetyl esterase/lipase
MATRPYPRTYVKKVVVEDGSLGGVPVVSFVPPQKKRGGAVLFFHGGSYVYGSSKNSHGDLIAKLALESGAKVIAVEYRLAPEHPYPAQLDDAIASFDALVASGTPSSEIVIAGDSAGGNLAIAAALALRDRGGVQAKALALLSPWVDLTMPGASYAENDPFDFGTRDVLAAQAKEFAGDVPIDDARVSPTFAKLAGLPPSLVVVGEAELPRDDIRAFAAKLKEAGVDVTLREASDMSHNAAFFADYHPSAKAAFDALVAFVSTHLPSR